MPLSGVMRQKLIAVQERGLKGKAMVDYLAEEMGEAPQADEPAEEKKERRK